LTKRIPSATKQKRQKIVTEWRDSGLSQAEFCRQKGISQWQLSDWKRREAPATGKNPKPSKRKATKLGAAGIEFAAADLEMDSSFLEQIPSPKVGSFVPIVPSVLELALKGIRTHGKHELVSAEIQFGGMTLRIFSGADRETPRALLQTLQECSLC